MNYINADSLWNMASNLWDDLKRHTLSLFFHKKCFEANPKDKDAERWYRKCQEDCEEKSTLVCQSKFLI